MPKSSNPLVITKDNFDEYLGKYVFRDVLDVTNKRHKFPNGLVVKYVPSYLNKVILNNTNLLIFDVGDMDMSNMGVLSIAYNPTTLCRFGASPRYRLNLTRTDVEDVNGRVAPHCHISIGGTPTSGELESISGEFYNEVRIKRKLKKFVNN